jgi:hypothetical protein
MHRSEFQHVEIAIISSYSLLAVKCPTPGIDNDPYADNDHERQQNQKCREGKQYVE